MPRKEVWSPLTQGRELKYLSYLIDSMQFARNPFCAHRREPQGLSRAPLRRERAVRVLSSFATKTKKSRRDTAGLAAPQSKAEKVNLRDSPAPSQTAHRAVCAPLRRERAVRVLSSFAAKTKKSRRDTAGFLFWWRMRDSNPRPLRCERSALTS